jgi:class 3 adenylate cyclase
MVHFQNLLEDKNINSRYLSKMPFHLFVPLAIGIAVLFFVYLKMLYPYVELQSIFLGYFIVGLYGWYLGKSRSLVGALILYASLAIFASSIGKYQSILNRVLAAVTFISIPLITSFVSSLYRELKETKEELSIEHQKNAMLLENILPPSIAKRLKNGEKLIADSYEESTVLFFDLVGFTSLASTETPENIVELLNHIVCTFDSHVDTLHLEKIKTIGDAYMVVSGLPEKRADHAVAIADMALAMKKSMAAINLSRGSELSMRIGVHSGPVVGGVIGHKKFTFDLWGDTVNIASRLESHGIPGEIQVSENTYNYIKDLFVLEPRGEIDLKNRGIHKAWILKGRN